MKSCGRILSVQDTANDGFALSRPRSWVALAAAALACLACSLTLALPAYAVDAMPGSGLEGSGCFSHPGELVTLDDVNTASPAPTNMEGALRKIRSAVDPEYKTMPLLVIAVGFDDLPYANDINWAERIFGGDLSVSRYYTDMSLGKFTFCPAEEVSAYSSDGNLNVFDAANDGVVHVSVGKNHDDWTNMNSRSASATFAAVLSSAVMEADRYVDFASYDANGNGKLENNEIAIGFVIAGYEAASTSDYSERGKSSFLWSHAWDIASAISYGRVKSSVSLPVPDGVSVSNYIAIAERLSDGTASPIGTLTHELGHYLGLPDLYDTKYSSGQPWSSYLVGELCLMANGSWGRASDSSFRPTALSAPCREMLGWVSPKEIDDGQDGVVVAQDFSSGNSTYQCTKIPVDGSENEYYLVENRRHSKWDEPLAYSYSGSGGAVLWHVDQNIIGNYPHNVNDADHHPGIMPLYIEKGSGGALVLLGTRPYTSKVFMDASTWASKYQPTIGDALVLPKYAPAGEDDVPGNRVLSETAVYFGSARGTDVPIGIGAVPCDHELSHCDAIDPTCTEDGAVEHWSCDVCGKLFSDGAGRHEIDENDVTVPASGHALAHHDGQDATCDEGGAVEYWSCDVCGALFSDAAATCEIEDVVVPATGHSLVRVGQVPPTCRDAGSEEHWECSRCGKLFFDEQAQLPVSEADLAIETVPHALVWHDAAEPTCTEDGNVGFWECVGCGGAFADEDGMRELDFDSDVKIASLGHDLAFHEEVQPTCASCGNVAHWECSRCGKLFLDEQTEKETDAASVEIEALGHVPAHLDAAPATCDVDGLAERWLCSRCGSIFSDPDCETEIDPQDAVVPRKGHELEHVAPKCPTCDEGGWKEHWDCRECGKSFADAAAKLEMTTEEIESKAFGHVLVHSGADVSGVDVWACQVCGLLFSDADGEELVGREDVPVPSQHRLEAVEERVSGCSKCGHIRYWTCPHCSKFFTDPEGEHEVEVSALLVPAAGHDLHHVDIQLPTCEEPGLGEHWECSECGMMFEDEFGSFPIEAADIEIPAAGHWLLYLAEQKETCSNPGRKAYWECSTCGKCYLDEDGAVEISEEDTVIPANGKHTWDAGKVTRAATESAEGVKTYTCTHCPATKTESIPKLPKKGKAKDGTDFGTGATAANVDSAIAKLKGDKDPAGTMYAALKLRSTKQATNSVVLAWSKQPKAVKYVVYGGKSGSNNKMSKVATVTGASCTVGKVGGKKLAKGTYYKFMVVALDKSGKVVSSSKLVHVTTTGGKNTNVKTLTTAAKKDSVALKKNKTFKLAAKTTKQNTKLAVKTYRNTVYETSNKKVATVSSSGVIKAVGKGTCCVYVYTQNGIGKTILVTVS